MKYIIDRLAEGLAICENEQKAMVFHSAGTAAGSRKGRGYDQSRRMASFPLIRKAPGSGAGKCAKLMDLFE